MHQNHILPQLDRYHVSFVRFGNSLRVNLSVVVLSVTQAADQLNKLYNYCCVCGLYLLQVRPSTSNIAAERGLASGDSRLPVLHDAWNRLPSRLQCTTRNTAAF